jgi:hypothetical protein
MSREAVPNSNHCIKAPVFDPIGNWRGRWLIEYSLGLTLVERVLPPFAIGNCSGRIGETIDAEQQRRMTCAKYIRRPLRAR